MLASVENSPCRWSKNVDVTWPSMRCQPNPVLPTLNDLARTLNDLALAKNWSISRSL